MHVRQITLINVRQFSERTFAFQPGFNVLVGENGAGKTSLLRSLQVVLGSARQSGRRASLTDDDIRVGANALFIEADVSDPPDRCVFTYTKELFGRARRRSKPTHVSAPLVLFYGANEATTSNFKSRPIKHRRGAHGGNLPSQEEEFLYRTERGFDADVPAEQRFGRSEAIRSFVIEALTKISDKFINFAWRFEPYRRTPSSQVAATYRTDARRFVMPQRSVRAERLSEAAQRYFSLLKSNDAEADELRQAEEEYRRASEPFTDNPAAHALLKVEKLEADIQ